MRKIVSATLAALLVVSLLPAAALTEEDTTERQYIESVLNLANSEDQEWSYSADADAWVLSVVSAVAYPELPDQEGVSVCTPGAYVTGIDTDGDGVADITAETYEEAVRGSLILDREAEVISTGGQVYTADTAPVILTTGAAGYGSSNNSKASTGYAGEGYISVSCGNRGKQDAVTDESGNVLYYTGDAPSCLVDQKAATRFVKYNILLGNLPGNVDCFVSTGGSGGAAHASMFAATGNHADFYDYQIEVGAVGVYKNGDGSYTTTVTIDGQDVAISDGAWGCVAYSAIASLYEADAAQAFEYTIDTAYSFGSSFQEELAGYLSEAYMHYINEQNLQISEADIGLDLNGDATLEDTIALQILYDPQAYPETNGYYGTYLDLYLASFRQNLQWYLDNLDYAEGWTWFEEGGAAMGDDAVAAMTAEEKAQAFIEGRYAKAASAGSMGGAPGGTPQDGAGERGTPPGDMAGMPAGDGATTDAQEAQFGENIRDGGPAAGTTASAGSRGDSSNYESFEEMAAAYAADIADIEAGDEYGNNIVSLYNPLRYIGGEGTDDPAWTRIVMGAVEGDMPLMASLNLQIAWLNAGVDAALEWQWDGGHVPSEVLGNSLSLYVDAMYGKAVGISSEMPLWRNIFEFAPPYVSGQETTRAQAAKQTQNGDATEATGKDISGWVNDADIAGITFSLADVLAYRNSGASKAVPGFDVIDYGQEDYVFGNAEKDARHWSVFVNDIFQNEAYAASLASVFNAGGGE